MPETKMPRCVVRGCQNDVPKIKKFFCDLCFNAVPSPIKRSLGISERLMARGVIGAEETHRKALERATAIAEIAAKTRYIDDDGIGPQSETEVVP